MKKFIATLLALIMIAALVACGSKDNDPQNQAGSGETAGQLEGPAATTEVTTGADDAVTDATGTTTDDENQITATVPKDDTAKDDIKIPVDGDDGEPEVPTETPDDGASDNVISFDDLLSVS